MRLLPLGAFLACSRLKFTFYLFSWSFQLLITLILSGPGRQILGTSGMYQDHLEMCRNRPKRPEFTQFIDDDDDDNDDDDDDDDDDVDDEWEKYY
jgi:hypothetical protein